MKIIEVYLGTGKNLKQMILTSISKSFSKKKVLQNIFVEFKKNSVNLIIGKNGSGKSTLLKIICGLIKRFEGNLKLKNTVYISDNSCFFSEKTGMENLNYILDKNEIENIDYYINVLCMRDYINDKVKTYSEGMKKKLNIVLALSKKCDLVLLDEPTNSLDMASINILKELLKEEKKKKTIIITSHDIAVFDDSLIDNVFVLKNKCIIEYENNKLNYNIYKVKTENIIKEGYKVIFEKDGYYYIKVKKKDVCVLTKSLIKYGLTEFELINYLDELYLSEIL